MKRITYGSMLFLIVFLVLMQVDAFAISCTITIDVAPPVTDSESAPWTGCGASGQGLVSALDYAKLNEDSTHGSDPAYTVYVTFTNTGSLLVRTSVQLSGHYNLTVQGSPRAKIIGENTAGLPYRVAGIGYFPGESKGAIFRSFFNYYVTIKNVDFSGYFVGTDATRILGGPAVYVLSSVDTTVSNMTVIGARRAGFIARSGRGTIVQDNTVTMSTPTTQSEITVQAPGAGEGMWDNTVMYDKYLRNTVTAPDYYKAGASAAPMDLISIYQSGLLTADSNKLNHGNSDGIYYSQPPEGDITRTWLATSTDEGNSFFMQAWDPFTDSQQSYAYGSFTADSTGKFYAFLFGVRDGIIYRWDSVDGITWTNKTSLSAWGGGISSARFDATQSMFHFTWSPAQPYNVGCAGGGWFTNYISISSDGVSLSPLSTENAMLGGPAEAILLGDRLGRIQSSTPRLVYTNTGDHRDHPGLPGYGHPPGGNSFYIGSWKVSSGSSCSN